MNTVQKSYIIVIKNKILWKTALFTFLIVLNKKKKLYIKKIKKLVKKTL